MSFLLRAYLRRVGTGERGRAAPETAGVNETGSIGVTSVTRNESVRVTDDNEGSPWEGAPFTSCQAGVEAVHLRMM